MMGHGALFLVAALVVGVTISAAAESGSWLIPALFFGWLAWLQFGKRKD